MVNLTGHEAGNGGYSQGTPKAHRAFLYSEKRAHRGSHHDLTNGRNPYVFRSDGVFGNHSYHSGAMLVMLKNAEVRTYIPERKQKGQRDWGGTSGQQQAVYAARRRVNGAYGKRVLRKRGELIERSFAHCYDTGGMRRTHLRGHQNILKRPLIHVGAFNLSLIFRCLLGAGTPREWKNRQSSLLFVLLLLFHHYSVPKSRTNLFFSRPQLGRPRNKRNLRYKLRHSRKCGSATDY